ncbi:hypothetical protein SLEP1_g19042 [Rubroshorea leprosula]|nr:hypothetical protein SLEP1_g19042 [Rubroshorea leprosula]
MSQVCIISSPWQRDALAATISSGKVTFYSRSKSILWTKGETTKNFHDIFLHCDRHSVYTCNFFIGLSGPTGHVLCLDFTQSEFYLVENSFQIILPW